MASEVTSIIQAEDKLDHKEHKVLNGKNQKRYGHGRRMTEGGVHGL